MLLTKGMLWVDDTAGRPLVRKVEQAASYYQSKYGAMPNICYVHPSALSDAITSEGRIRILEARVGADAAIFHPVASVESDILNLPMPNRCAG